MIFVSYAGIQEILPNKYRYVPPFSVLPSKISTDLVALCSGIGLAWTEFCINVPFGITGTLVASKLASDATWRWCYYIVIIFAGVTGAGVALTYFPPQRPQEDFEKTRWQEVMELDFIGIALYATGLTVFLIGWSWAGNAGHAWKSASVIVPIVVGFLVFCLCFAYDWTLAKKPFFPYHLFARVREFTVILVVLFVSGMVFFANAALLPQASLYIFNSNPIKLGLIQLPNGFGQFVGGAVIPSFIHKFKHLRIQIVLALVIQTLFTGLYAATLPSHKAAWMAFQFFGQMCFSWVTLCSYVVVGLHVKQKDLGTATGIVGTFRNAGGSVGSAIFATILHGVVGDQLGPRITKAALANGFSAANLATLIPAVADNAVGVPHAFAKVPGITPAVEAATGKAFKEAYAYAFQRVFYSTIPFGVIAIIAGVFVNEASTYLTNHTAVQMEKNVLGDGHAHHEHTDMENSQHAPGAKEIQVLEKGNIPAAA